MAPRRARTVLIVHPDEERGEAVADALRARGLAARAVHAVHLALRVAESAAPDAWIVDADLPGMRGHELVRSLRASPRAELRDARLVGLAHDRTGAARFADAGADATVVGPVGADALVAALTGAVAAFSSTEA